MKVYVVLCNYAGGSYVFRAHGSQEGALATAEEWNQEARDVGAAAKRWRDSGYEGDEPDDLELEEHFYTVEGVEVKP